MSNLLFGFLLAEKQRVIAGIVPAIEKARLYRGKGGEIMRSAVSRFIECISQAQISLTEKIKRSLLDTLNENLKHPNSQIQVFLFTKLNLLSGTFSYACLLNNSLLLLLECCC